MISVGMDLSLTGTGIVTLENGLIKDKQLIKSKPNDGKPTSEVKRIYQIREQIPLPTDTKDVLAVIEGVSFGIQKTTSVSQLSGLTYLVRTRLWLAGIPFVIVAPTTLKKYVTGRGNAQKDEMMLETYKRWHVSFEENNTCDAYGLAQIGMAILADQNRIEYHGLTKWQYEIINKLKEQFI
jgi:crossover junction endodeoxyribonuclease RuvC